MEHRITEKTLLLDKRGHLIEKGYATKMNFIYNREQVKRFPLKLKEWNFYQFIKNHYSLQLTLGHVSYMCSVSATLIDLLTGKKWNFGTMKPLFVPELDRDPERESVLEFRDKDVYLAFSVTKNQRLLTVKGANKEFKQVDIHLAVDFDPENEKMVIATPFHKPTQFYLNYKENYYHGTGTVQFGDMVVDFDGCTGLIDWGRGVWPYSHQWFWGNLSSHIDGVPFGFNIGWGFGDLSHATENMYFYDKKAYKVGELVVKRDESDDMKPWSLNDGDGKMRMTFTPLYDNYTENKYVVVDTHCNQVYGYFDGVIETDRGYKEFHHVLAFIEHAVNHW
ncbi:MAG: DUF2804 domain-containing protein [Lachnospiraceae bacterium]|nr:DUF2804 domain-containing protein [Lachnospiraceae bacterium]